MSMKTENALIKKQQFMSVIDEIADPFSKFYEVLLIFRHLFGIA